jgi:hypothetical protein
VISAIIPAKTRPENLPRIIYSLPYAEIIIVRDDSVWTRYEAMRRAKFDIIYTQDDDVVNHSLPLLLESYLKHPDLIHYSVPTDYLGKIPNKTWGNRQLALIGWGSMFHRSRLQVLDKYTNKYGIDDLLLREVDRAFTILQGRHHVPVVCDLERLPGETDGRALSSQPNHIELTNKMIERCLGLCE